MQLNLSQGARLLSGEYNYKNLGPDSFTYTDIQGAGSGTTVASGSTIALRRPVWAISTGVSNIDVLNPSTAPTGVELGFAQTTADFTTASASLVDVTGVTVTVTIGTRPVMVYFYCAAVSNSTSAGTVNLAMVQTAPASTTNVALTSFNITTAKTPVYLAQRYAPAAGTATWKMQASVGSGTATLSAAVGSFFNPMYMQVVEI